MDVLNNSKLRLKKSFESKVAEIEALLDVPGEPPVTVQLQGAFAQLQARWTSLEKIYDEILELLDKGGDEEAVRERAERTTTEKDNSHDDFLALKVAIEFIIESRKPQPVPEPLPQSVPVPEPGPDPPSNRVRVKLPQLELRSFDGDILKWMSFWDGFNNAVHSRTDLRDEEKFNYLRRYLTGSALKSIEGLSLTSIGYLKAIDILTQEYGQKEIVVQTRLLHLSKIQDARRVTDSASLRKLYSEVNGHIRELEALGHPVDSLGSFIVTLLLQKMPSDLQVVWMRDRTRSSTDHEALMAFIRNELIALDQRDRLNEREAPEAAKPATKDAKPAGKTTAAALTASATKADQPPCLFCGETSHRSGKCKMDLEGRKSALMKAGRCFSCTKRGHRSSDCPENRKCANCGGSHHVFICTASKKASGSSESKPAGDAPTECLPAKAMIAAPTRASAKVDGTLFMTGLLFVHGSSGKEKCRILIDSCSKLSYITKRLAKSVNPRLIKKEWLKINGFGGVVTEKKARKWSVEVGGLRDPDALYTCEAYETELICGPIPRVSTENWLHQMAEEGLPLADEAEALNDPDWSGEIDLLLGARDVARVLTGKMKRIDDSTLAVETIFGWVVIGEVSKTLDDASATMMLSIAQPLDLEDDDRCATRLWELEAIGIDEDLSTAVDVNADSTVVHFESTIKLQDGRYHVKLPWKENHPLLPSNKDLVTSRLKVLLRRMKNSPELMQQYAAHLQDHADRGFTEEVPVEELNGRPGAVHYLHHRPVIRADKVSTKIRSVFDASAGQPSLNSCLETGPNLIRPLMDILIRFRQHKIAMTADIEKAFLQIRLAPEDRDLVRFLWVDDPLAAEPQIKHYRWKSVVFGVTTSPFLLSATIRHHATKYVESHPGTTKILLNDMYMDDLITGSNDQSEAERLARESTEILSQAGMPLRRWITNNVELQATLSPGEISPQSGAIEFSDVHSKVLGLVWHPATDCFTFDPRSFLEYYENFSGRCTKRHILSASARIFDPVGLISPLIVVPKILLQKIWQLGVHWDEALPIEIEKQWSDWAKSLIRLSEIKIPRHYFLGQPEVTKIELHFFSDASEKAYGTVCYLRSEDSTGQCRVALVASRTRVAPIKRITLPRLELMGCFLSARLAKSIKKSLSSDIICLFWSDSQVALSWIQKPSNSLKPFVANRVQTIQCLSTPSSWRFVPGKENPADLCSRGVSAPTLVDPNSIWWQGPDWLIKSQADWPPPFRPDETPAEARCEFKKATCLIVHSTLVPVSMFKFTDFGRLARLLRYTAHILRAFGNATADSLGRPELRRDGALSATELSLARNYWFRYIQLLSFGGELEELRKKGRVLHTSSLATLNPFLDPSDGLIKLRGRTEASNDLNYSPSLPILPGKTANGEVNHFIALLVRDAHLRLLHTGVRDTLVELRETCWILRGRQVVKQVLKTCVPCNRIQRKPFEQSTAPLPTDRCSFAPPFEITGLDYAGPFYLNDSDTKAWMCLFTCAVTRAVHLELVNDLTTSRFLLALDRFIGRRGLCRVIYSDNARTFKRAAREIADRWKGIDADLAREMGQRGINWKFIVEGAPWWGGWWERLVGSVKSLLKKVLGRASLSADELDTLLIRVEAVLNSRPITFVYDDHKEPQPLCPSDFLIGRRLMSLPPLSAGQIKVTASNQSNLIERFLLRERLMAEFKQRWTAEYLQERSQHFRRLVDRRGIRLGEIVIIRDETVKRQNWRMGVVVELFRGRDDKIRAVRVKTAFGDFKRPVQKLCSLEICEELQAADLSENGLEEGATAMEAEPVEENPDEDREPPSSGGEDVEKELVKTRLGRTVRPVHRLGIVQ